MHPARRFAQIVEAQVRPILAVAVRKNAIGGRVTTKIEQGISHELRGADRLHCERFSCRVLDVHLHGGVGRLIVKLDDKNQVRFPGKAGVCDGDRAAGAEIVGEFGFRRFVMRIVARTQPRMIDLRAGAASKDRLAAPHRELIRSILGIRVHSERVVGQLLRGGSTREYQRHENDRDSSAVAQLTHFL
jgi:hypothetical protein